MNIFKIPAIKIVFKNTISLYLANIAEKGLLFILFMLMARNLGPEKYGIFFTAFALLNVIFIFGELGLSQYITREMSKCNIENADLVEYGLGIRIFTNIVMVLLVIGISVFTRYGNDVKLCMVILTVYFAICYFSHPFIAFLKAKEQMEKVAIIMIVERSIVTIVGIILLKLISDPNIVAYTFILGSIVRLFLGYNYTKKIKKNVKFEKLNFKKARYVLKSSIPMGIFMITSLVMYRIETILLPILKFSTKEVAWYNSGFNIYSIIMLPAVTFSMAIFPVFSRNFKKKKFQKWQLFRFC